MGETVLVVAPHPDDEVLGCGGTMARHARRGDTVNVLVATNGFVGAPELFSEASVEAVRREAREAHAELGVAETVFLDLPSPRLDTHPRYRTSMAFADVFSRFAPDVLYLPHAGDLHHDHGIVYETALVAARPFPGRKVSRIYCYETPSETEWGLPTSQAAFVPTAFHVLEERDVEAKTRAMGRFASQLREAPHPRSAENLVTLARYRGAIVGESYAEAFSVTRIIA